MHNQIKTSFLFYTFTLLVCLNSFFLSDTAAQDNSESTVASTGSSYTFESIDVPGVDFLAVTASSDFEDYAGYTKSADGEKEVGFTLIDGVFTTYDFPGSQKTHFYALGNNGQAAGHYQDSDGLFHGVVLENGELQQYDFPGALETQIFGISDATGALTGNFIGTDGVRRGFSGETIVEHPDASATYADFVNSSGRIVGSYVDAEGLYHTYIFAPDGRFYILDYLDVSNLEYFFLHGLNDAGILVGRAKAVDDVPRTYVGSQQYGLHELQYPGSVVTEGWNINLDRSVVGHYDTADGNRHGFIAKPTEDTATQPTIPDVNFNYIFQSIDVPGVDFLELTASSDFDDYAGNTRSPDGEKTVGFTLIDGVFTTYDFPGSQNTYFYALGNNGNAAGHYEDSDGHYHGVILENGELRQYDFPDAVETQIFGISDATGVLTGNFIGADGVRRGFSGDRVIVPPEAYATYADFVYASLVVGSYVDAEGLYHSYAYRPDGSFIILNYLDPSNLDYFFLHGLNDTGIVVGRAKAVDDVPRTYVGSLQYGIHEVQYPGSVITQGWNINQDGSVVGHYDSADGRRHGFIARLTTEEESTQFGNAYTVTLSKGLNMVSLPLATPKPMTAKSLAGISGATVVIALDAENQSFVGWTPAAPNDGFTIEGGQGYIVNVPQPRNFAFVGSRWINQTEEVAAAPTIAKAQETWAFVVSGQLEGTQNYDGYLITVRNTRTNTIMTAQVTDHYFAAATADLARRSVVQVGDTLEVTVSDNNGNIASEIFSFEVTSNSLANALLTINLDGIGKPNGNLLLQNYPNPFNPETWIPYQLSNAGPVSISIYDTTGGLVRKLTLGHQSEGFYYNRGRAAYWDGKNTLQESVASGIYFYKIETPSFQQTRRLVILK